MMNLWIGLDDTDTLESRGTGRLAREIAGRLCQTYNLSGVTRHQLLVDACIPYTSHNSSAAIVLNSLQAIDPIPLFTQIRAWMLDDFQPGSDPGLCMLAGEVPVEVIEFGRQAQQEVVSQSEAHRLAGAHGILLEGLGGTQDGIIGALAAVGLAASGEDGRYILVGRSRELSGLQPVEAVLSAGISDVRTLEGDRVESGLILSDKLRPARHGGKPVAYVTWQESYWAPVKIG